MKFAVSLTLLVIMATSCHAAYGKVHINQQEPYCPELKPERLCDSVQHTVTPNLHYYIHLCPGPGGSICYLSQLPICNDSNLICLTKSTLTVSGKEIVVKIHRRLAGKKGDIYCFKLDVDIGSCCDVPTPTTTPPTTLPPTTPPTTLPPTTPPTTLPPTTTGEPQPPCEPDIYFILDPSDSIHEQSFCRLAYTIQVIRAAIDATKTTLEAPNVATVLYESVEPFDTYEILDPTYAFRFEDSCEAAVQVNLTELIFNFKIATGDNFMTLAYPNVRACSTLPSSAILFVRDEIIRRQPQNATARLTSVITLSDGNNKESPVDAIKELSETTSTKSIIAGGIGNRINTPGLRNLTLSDSGVIRVPDFSIPIDLAIPIIEKVRDDRGLCSNEQAKRIIEELERYRTVLNDDTMTEYCNAIFKEEFDHELVPKCAATGMMSKLEKMIFAAIEEVIRHV